MTSKRIAGWLTGLLLAFGLAPGWVIALEGDPERGQTAAGICVACHQDDGSGMNVPGGESWPRLAGLSAKYLAKQLYDFKEGRRENVTMVPFANMLNDQQIADVAIYYSQMPVTAAQGGSGGERALLDRGEQLALRGDWNEYIVSCRSCHGPRNEGAGDTFPGVASQQAGYIEAQLRAWQAGGRNNDPQNLMGAIAKRLSDEDIRAVSAWLASQSVESK